MKSKSGLVVWVVTPVLLLFVGSFMLPSSHEVSVKIWINAPGKVVFSQLEDLHQWNKWAGLFKGEQDRRLNFFNHGVGELSGFEWNNDIPEIGSGSLKILKSKRYESIEMHLSTSAMKGMSYFFYLKSKGEGVVLTWKALIIVGNNPIYRWRGLWVKRKLEEGMEKDLQMLNAIALRVNDSKQYIVEKGFLQPFAFASIRESVSLDEISLKMGTMFGRVSDHLSENQTTMTGMPFAMYHLMTDTEIDMECGLPIPNEIPATNEIISGTVPLTSCAIVDYYGDYMRLEEGHVAIQDWIAKHGFSIVGSPIEVYLTDPGMEPDPSNWLTRIYYPIGQ